MGVGIGVGVGSKVGVGVGAGVGVGSGVGVDSGVGVGSGVGVDWGVAVGSSVGVGVASAVGVGSDVGDCVGVNAGVGDGSGEGVGAGVGVGVAVGSVGEVGVGVDAGVGTGSTVGVGASLVTVVGVDAGVGPRVGDDAGSVTSAGGAVASPHARNRKLIATIRPAIRDLPKGKIDSRVGATRRRVSRLRTRQFTQRANHPHSANRGQANASVSCLLIARRIRVRVSRVDRVTRGTARPHVIRATKTRHRCRIACVARQATRSPAAVGPVPRRALLRRATCISLQARTSPWETRPTGKFCRCRT